MRGGGERGRPGASELLMSLCSWWSREGFPLPIRKDTAFALLRFHATQYLN